jgi:O-antigen/teichoic acid export membrane protein
MLLNILKYGLSEGLAKLAPFLTTLYVAQFLEPELFGKYSLIVVMFEITFIIISFNIQATTRIDYFKESKTNFVILKQNHLIISCIFAGMGILSLFFLEREDQIIVSILTLSALLRTSTVFILAIFQCSRKVNAYIYSNITFVFVLSLSIFVFLNFGASYHSWLFAMLIASLVQFLLVLKLHSFKEVKIYWPKAITYNSLKLAFIPAALFMPQAIGWWLKSGAERMIISDALGNSVLGVYSLALQFVSILFIYITVVNLAIVPEINKLMKSNNFKKMHRYLLINVAFLTFVSLLLPIISKEVIISFYPVSYLLASDYILLLTLASIPQAIMMLYINVLYFNNEGRYVAIVILLSFAIQTLINFNFISVYDIKGVIACSGLVGAIALYLILAKVYRLKV